MRRYATSITCIFIPHPGSRDLDLLPSRIYGMPTIGKSFAFYLKLTERSDGHRATGKYPWAVAEAMKKYG